LKEHFDGRWLLRAYRAAFERTTAGFRIDTGPRRVGDTLESACLVVLIMRPHPLGADAGGYVADRPADA
jgi:hypothetical protein